MKKELTKQQKQMKAMLICLACFLAISVILYFIFPGIGSDNVYLENGVEKAVLTSVFSAFTLFIVVFAFFIVRNRHEYSPLARNVSLIWLSFLILILGINIFHIQDPNTYEQYLARWSGLKNYVSIIFVVLFGACYVFSILKNKNEG